MPRFSPGISGPGRRRRKTTSITPMTASGMQNAAAKMQVSHNVTDSDHIAATEREKADGKELDGRWTKSSDVENCAADSMEFCIEDKVEFAPSVKIGALGNKKEHGKKPLVSPAPKKCRRQRSCSSDIDVTKKASEGTTSHPIGGQNQLESSDKIAAPRIVTPFTEASNEANHFVDEPIGENQGWALGHDSTQLWRGHDAGSLKGTCSTTSAHCLKTTTAHTEVPLCHQSSRVGFNLDHDDEFQTFHGKTSSESGQQLNLHEAAEDNVLSQTVLAIDARVPETSEGDAVGQNFLRDCEDFLVMTYQHNVLPVVLATPKAPKKPFAKRPSRPLLKAVASKPLRPRWDGTLPLRLFPFPVTVPANDGLVPKNLFACDSWRFFGDLVYAITDETHDRTLSQPIFNSRCNGTVSVAPLDVHIFTSDVAFMTDRNHQLHGRAINRFWERLRPKFQEKAIKSVTISIFDTGTTTCHDTGNKGASTSVPQPQEGSPVSEAMKRPLRPQIANFLLPLRERIQQLSQRDAGKRKKNAGGNDVPITMEIEFIDCRASYFELLVRRWTSQMRLSNADIPLPVGRITFDLGEECNAIPCKMALDLSLQFLSRGLDPRHIPTLVADLQNMQTTAIRAVQLIPMDLVDPSLVRGVPMVARGSLDMDAVQNARMQQLASDLWGYLREKKAALLMKYETQHDGVAAKEEYFLLRAGDEMRVSSDGETRNDGGALLFTVNPSTLESGILRKYDTNFHTFWDTREVSAGQLVTPKPENYKGAGHYRNTIGQSLETIRRGNPLFTNPMTSASSHDQSNAEVYSRLVSDGLTGNLFVPMTPQRSRSETGAEPRPIGSLVVDDILAMEESFSMFEY